MAATGAARYLSLREAPERVLDAYRGQTDLDHRYLEHSVYESDRGVAFAANLDPLYDGDRLAPSFRIQEVFWMSRYDAAAASTIADTAVANMCPGLFLTDRQAAVFKDDSRYIRMRLHHIDLVIFHRQLPPASDPFFDVPLQIKLVTWRSRSSVLYPGDRWNQHADRSEEAVCDRTARVEKTPYGGTRVTLDRPLIFEKFGEVELYVALNGCVRTARVQVDKAQKHFSIDRSRTNYYTADLMGSVDWHQLPKKLWIVRGWYFNDGQIHMRDLERYFAAHGAALVIQRAWGSAVANPHTAVGNSVLRRRFLRDVSATA